MAASTVERIHKEYREARSEARATLRVKPEVTKQAQLIRMLRAPTGVGVAAICSKLGWQAHTTRAALSRLRTAGFEIRREHSSNGRPARYRLGSSRRRVGKGAPMGIDPSDAIASSARKGHEANSELGRDIAALGLKDNAALRTAWRKAWGRDAPKGGRKHVLMLGIAWKWQVVRFCGFDRELARRLSALETRSPIGSAGSSARTADVSTAGRPVPSTRLVRDWQGERYEVHALESGYLWRGRRYGSLSSVAKAITGVSRNGPKFFGLRGSRD